MVEVPADYVINIIRQSFDERFNSLEKTIEIQFDDVKKDICDLKDTFKHFEHTYGISMKDHENRLKEIEQFKYKVYAYTGAIAVFSGVAIKIIFG